MPSLIETTIEGYRQRVLMREAEQMRIMASRWLDVENSLAAQVSLLAQSVAEMQAAGKTPTPAKLYKLEHYQKLLAQAKAQVAQYNAWAAKEIAATQAALVRLGIDAAQAAIKATYLDAGTVGAYFDILPVEAVNAMIGYAGDGTPLSKLLSQSYPETIAALTDTLISSTAKGVNPRDTARLMADAMAGNLTRALTIARTEQLRAYRQANREQMQASGVVNGYVRRCALNDRTCMACIALDGTVYATDELMEVHPNDRCFMQPLVAGLDPVQTTSGAEWFQAQPEATQQSMMGPEKYAAWQDGQFQLEQLAKTSVDPVWGPTVRVASLSSLVE